MTATGVVDPNGVSSVLFAVYNQADGPNNYVSYSGTLKADGSYQATFDKTRHATKTGAFYVNVWGTDNNGNVGCMGTYSFIVDNQGPIMAGFTPNNMTIYSTTTTMTATGVYDPSGISNVLFSVWNEADGTDHYIGYWGQNTGNGTYQATFDKNKHITKIGKFYVNVWSTDKLDNSRCIGTYSFTIEQDASAPTVEEFTPKGTINVSSVIISATGVTDQSGVSSVSFSIWNRSDGTEKYVAYPATNMGAGTWQATFDAAKHITQSGTFYTNVWGTDIEGNVRCMGTYSFIVDLFPSTIQKLDIGYSGTDIVLKAINVQDSSGISSVVVNIYNNDGQISNYINLANQSGGN